MMRALCTCLSGRLRSAMMAALQGYAPANAEINSLAVPVRMLAAESGLMAIAADVRTALGRAALWCGAQSNTDEAWIKACRIKALEGHLACTLPQSVTDTLGLHGFEQSEAYSKCRMNAAADARKVESR